jgi:hypothetical protein
MWRILLSISVVLLAAAAAPLVGAQTATQVDLERAVLSADEIGEGFTLRSSRPFLTSDTPSVSSHFSRTAGLTVESILIMLDTSILGVDGAIAAARAAILSEPTLRTSPASAPSIGADTQRLSISGTLSGAPVRGDVIAWRYGEVKALVAVLTTGTRSAQPYAERQQAKLVSVLGGSQPPVTGAPAGGGAMQAIDQAGMQAAIEAPYRALVTCLSFTHQEAAQAILLAYPGDPYGLDADGNGLACEDLPMLSDADPIRAGGPASPAAAPRMAAAAPAPTVLFEARGQGGTETDNFTVPGRIELCWEISGRSPSGAFGAEASFFFYPAGRMTSVNSASLKTGNGCQFLNLPAGTYYIKVIATSWSSWRVTVRRA